MEAWLILALNFATPAIVAEVCIAMSELLLFTSQLHEASNTIIILVTEKTFHFMINSNSVATATDITMKLCS